MAEDPGPARTASGPLLRRMRRAVDCSRRELARHLGISASAVAQAETGVRDLPVSLLVRAAGLAGLRLGLLDASGQEVPGMLPDGVCDRTGRRFPAHLDTRHGDVWWWHGSERHSRERPTYTFDRDRRERDARRAWEGTPPDHLQPRAGDSLAERAQARQDAARAAERAAAEEFLAERRRLGFPDAWAPTCTCPPACDELLFPSAPLPAWQNAVPHVEDCPCRCDIA